MNIQVILSLKEFGAKRFAYENCVENEADHSAKEYSKIKELLEKKRCL
ncbi:hypothetical protein [Chryseobacterium nematophagum]|nr:hypothetical protein [Chryseobacterium nematophagum]